MNNDGAALSRILRDVGVVVAGLVVYAVGKHILYALYLGTAIQAFGLGF